MFLRIRTEYIQSKCGKIRTRKTPNTETFHAVNIRKIRTKSHTHHEQCSSEKFFENQNL